MTSHQELSGVRGVALTVRFLLELALLAGAAAVAWRLVGGWAGIVVAVAAVLAIAVVWGLLLSPKANVRLPEAAKLGIETLLFALVAVGLAATGLWIVAAAGFAIWVIHRLVLAATSRKRQ